MYYKKMVLVLISSLLLSACGGGGSSSGSNNADKNVTRCIRAERVNTPSGGFDSESRYTNTCDFTVSLAYIIPASARGPVTLPPGAVHTDLFGSVRSDGYIACRPPSQATNRGDNLDVRLDCT